MPNGLEAVFLENRSRLLRFLLARGAKDSAEDLLHELWIRCGRATSAPVADPLAYLFRAADNLVLDRHRSLSRRARRDEEWVRVAGGSSVGFSWTESGEDLAITRDQLRQAQVVLAELGDRTDLIFRRFRLEGLSQQQIASEFGISVSAVEKHLQRAYRALISLRDHQNVD